MNAERWNQVDRLLDVALELSPDKRGAFLDQACAGDETLRKEVDALLISDEGARSFLEQPALDVAAKVLANKNKAMSGQMVGHYKFISQVGSGGMGEVYLAKDTKLDRQVALKILPSGLAADRSRMQHFVQEAKAASALNHPNILTIHEVGEADGQHFIVTEFIDGMTLRERLAAPLDIEEALDIAIQISSALAAAHKVHIVHRDIKPENIMIRKDDGLVKVLDFGLAKMIPPRQPVDSAVDTTRIANTRPGVVMGTVAYMSPEQARGDTVDGRTDIWSLGVVLHEMIAGCSPFAAGASHEIIASILSRDSVPPLSRYSRVVPERLEEIVEKALSKNRDDRYQTIKDLLIDLKRLRQTLETKAAIDRSTSPDQVRVPASRTQTPATESRTYKTQTASSAEYIVNQLRSHKKATVAGAAVLLVSIVTFTSVLIYRSGRRSSVSAAPAISSIAVLPFSNAGFDPDTDFIADGITDNIIERLSQLPNFKVMSHTAVFHYKGQAVDPRAIGNELGVEAILTGRLIKRNDAIAISLELVNAKDNSHIWGGQYDRKLSELLALQQEIPLDVSDTLRLKLSGESKERLTHAPTDNAEAYQLYLKGRSAWEKWSLEGAKQAVAFFEEAIRKDPNYALAYAGLADAYIFGAGAGAGLPQKEAHRRAREDATKALSIDPQLGEAHAALAEILLHDDWDFAGAEREFKRAIELSPSYAECYHQYSHLLLLLGRIDESFVVSKKLLELDPVSQTPSIHLAYHYLYARQYDESIQEYKRALQLYPDAPPVAHIRLGDAYYQKGMYKEAVEEYFKTLPEEGLASDGVAALREAFARLGIKGYQQKRVEQLKGASQTDREYFIIAALYARLGEKDQSFAWLEKAYAAHSDELVRLKEEVGFDNLRSDQRYADLLRRIGLPQ